MTHVLVVDDEPHLLRALTMNLTARGYQVSSSTTGGGALNLVATLRPDLLILDLGLPDMDGLEVIRRLRARAQSLAILILSARSAQPGEGCCARPRRQRLHHQTVRHERTSRPPARRTPTHPPRRAQSVISLGIATIDLAARRVSRTNRDGSVDDDLHTPHPDRMAHARNPASPPRHAHHTSRAAGRNAGRTRTHRPELPSHLRAAAPPQARDRSQPSPTPAHRTGSRLPVHALSSGHRPPVRRRRVHREGPRGPGADRSARWRRR